MASDDLRRLWKVNELDVALAKVRAEAAKMDGGAAAKKTYEAAKAQAAPIAELPKTLDGERIDLELQDRTLAERRDKVEKEMYSGSGLGAKEIALREKEMEAIDGQRVKIAVRIAEIAEALPKAKARAAAADKAVAGYRKSFEEVRDGAAAAQEAMRKRFAELTTARATAAKLPPAPLLARYEAIRAKKAPGMAKVEALACGVCGTTQPEKTLLALKDGRIATCEGCSRLLYWTEGLL